jgi:hypothetical protein
VSANDQLDIDTDEGADHPTFSENINLDGSTGILTYFIPVIANEWDA